MANCWKTVGQNSQTKKGKKLNIWQIATTKNKCVFLDRDGVINVDKGYISNISNFKIYPGVGKAINFLNKKKYLVIIITNQSGIGRKIFSIEMLNAIHKKMSINLAQYGGVIDGIFFCPCAPEENCNCRNH